MKTTNKIKKLMVFILVCALLLPDLTVLAGTAQPTDGKTGPAMEFTPYMDVNGCVYSDGSWTAGRQNKLAVYSAAAGYDAGGFTIFLPGIDSGCVEEGANVTAGSIKILPFPTNTSSAAVSTLSADFPMDEPSTDKPSADNPSIDDPSVEESSADDSPIDEPSADDPSADTPSADEPSIDKASPDELFASPVVSYVPSEASGETFVTASISDNDDITPPR